MPWHRLGLVYRPDGAKAWARSHAALPVPLQIGPDLYRVFFSTRDVSNRSSVGWVEVELASAPRILREASEPALAPGEDGTFDDSGVGIGCLVPTDGDMRLYYMGWNLGVRSKWRNALGFAKAAAPYDRFERFSPGPILDRSPEDPYTLSYPWILKSGSDDWRMWYGSNLSASTSDDGMRHAVKLARSNDGIHWQRDGLTAIGFARPDEYAIARPTVVNIGDKYLMCFACRGDRYRIGAAWSSDAIHWVRIDQEMGLSSSPDGWDSRMVCYPALFFHRKRLWLAYNGDDYGSTGFGLAVWDGAYPF
jgi:hypothetical protein